ncbi:MAG: type II secretion system F family protein [Eubacteriales bacterium]|nr:type II secretion system F family protein [Eubacteriales bacterium]
MALFSYKAKATNGKVINGKIESRNQQEAITELSHMDLIVFDVKPVSSFLHQDIMIGGRKLKEKDFVVFLRQFATLMDAGILLLDAVELLAEQTESLTLQAALKEISQDIQGGMPLSDSMKKYPKLFPELLVQMIRSGELSGRLDSVLDQMATYYEKQYNLRQKVSSALTYPIVVAIFAIAVTVFMLIAIVPMFADMYASSGSELPGITRAVLAVSSFIQNYWWVLILVIVALIFAYKQIQKTEKGSYLIDKIKLKMPVMGKFNQKVAMARMTQTLSSLLASSVPILQSVEVTSRVVSNKVIEEVLLDARDSLERGKSLAEPMAASWVFPPLVVHMTRVGEKSGALDSMLSKVAHIYDQEVNTASDKLQSLIEPVLIVFLATVVGVIILSIVIPMFGMFEMF